MTMRFLSLCVLVQGALAQPPVLKCHQNPLESDAGERKPADLCAHAEKQVAPNFATDQIDWVRSKGGYISPKLEFQQYNSTDSSSRFDVFASKSIDKNETLMVIPHDCLIKMAPDACDTAMNLVKHYNLKEQSEYWPYVNYFFNIQRDILPASWSEEGKELLQDVIGQELPPQDFTTSTLFEDECPGHGSGDPLKEEALLFVLHRSWGDILIDILIPIFDMVNHRNGKWTNVDSTTATEGEDITVYATRDIRAGEQLYLSYNECADCENRDIALPHILRDYGFVEQYPRRWMFEVEGYDVVFELDEVPDAHGNVAAEEELLEVTWLTEEPDETEEHVLHGHLRRLQNLRENVYKRAEKLASRHERDTTIEFYQALTTALEHADHYYEDSSEGMDQEDVGADPGQTSSHAPRQYDGLEELPDPVSYAPTMYNDPVYGDTADHYNRVDQARSRHQVVEFYHNEEHKDTCLYLNTLHATDLHACMSFRPHYHEVVVHYPLSFIDRVRRVAFIGGGDNMLLHEILKYPSLELVVGLELDQQVARSSFRNFGSQPHWDDDRVEWWYGDAVTSLRLLPQEYYGTFDLVIIDLLTKVVLEFDIMDNALRLLAPDGIFVRNEDAMEPDISGFGSSFDFTKYTVDLYTNEVPLYCHQFITMGSNAVDFLRTTRKDHGVEMLYVDPADEIEERFFMWYNYKKNSTTTQPSCRKAGDAEKEKEKPASQKTATGILMVVEAEDVLIPLDSSASVQARIGKALDKAGLTVVSVKPSNINDTGKGSDMNAMMVFILREGYAVARTWPERKYCALDLLLWCSYDKQEAAKTELITVLGSKSSSSYRIITGGMFGASTWKEDGKKSGPPPATESCYEEATGNASAHNLPVKQSFVDTVLRESVSSLIRKNTTNVLVIVVCGEQSRGRCSALEALLAEKDDAVFGEKKVIPIWTCPGVVVRCGFVMNVCERDTRHSLMELVKTDGRIGGIVIDPEAPRSMGRVFHKILANWQARKKLLADDYVVLEASSLVPSDDSSSWRRALLDRFRTDFERYDPAYRAQLLFNDTASSLELGVFSSGDQEFYSHLSDLIAGVEKQTGLISDVQYVKNGFNNHIPDFKASLVTSHDDYNASSALEQWLSQKPLGRQTIFQFERDPDESPLAAAQVKKAMQKTLNVYLKSMNYDTVDPPKVKVYNEFGDGRVMVAFWAEGGVVVVWDGRAHVDVNLFTYEQAVQMHANFLYVFSKMFPSLDLTLRDDQPRGVGRVVNFQEDTGSLDEAPHWADQL